MNLITVICVALVLANCSAQSIIGGLIRRPFELSLADELKAFGPVAAVHCDIMEPGATPNVTAMDIRHKYFVGLNIDRNNSDVVMVTVVRTDNPMGRWFPAPQTGSGWSNRMMLHIEELDVHVNVPSNPNNEVLQFKVNLQGVQPVVEREIEVPRRVVVITRNERDVPVLFSEKILTLNKIRNPNYHFYTMAVEELGKYVLEWEGEKAQQLLHSVQAYALRVDYFRYMYLYHLGGIYIDSKIWMTVPFDMLIPEKGGMLFNEDCGSGIQNGLMMLPPGTDMMRRLIDEVSARFAAKYYSYSPTSITGPQLMMAVYYSLDEQDRSLIRLGGQSCFHIYATDVQNGHVVAVIYNEEYRRRSWPCDYRNLFYSHSIYYERLCHMPRRLR